MTKVLGAVALAVVLTLPVAAQQGHPQPQGTPQSQQQVGTAGAMSTVEAIVDNPEQFYDQTVTVAGEVNEVHGKRAFDIREKGVLDVDDKLLVISKKDLTNLDKDSMVEVRGKVQRFVKDDIAREHNITDWSDYGLDTDALSSFENRPVLIAENIQVRAPAQK